MPKILKYKKIIPICAVAIIILGLFIYYFVGHRWKKFEGNSTRGKHYVINYPPSWQVDDKTDVVPALLSLPDCYVGLSGFDVIPNNNDRSYYASMPKESVQIKNGTLGTLYINEQEEPIDNFATAIFSEFKLSLIYSNKSKNCVNEFKAILKTLELSDNSYRDNSGEIWKKFNTNNRFNLNLENFEKLEKLGMIPTKMELSYPNSWDIITPYNEISNREGVANVIISNYLMLSKNNPNVPEPGLEGEDESNPYYFANIDIDLGVSDFSLEKLTELNQNDSTSKLKTIKDKFLGYQAIKIYEKDDYPSKIFLRISPSTYIVIRSNIYIDANNAEYKKIVIDFNKIIDSIRFTNK